LVGCILAIVLLKYMSFKNASQLSLSMIILACIFHLFVSPTSNTARAVALFIMRVGMYPTLVISYIYNERLLPAEVRATLYSIISIFVLVIIYIL
jgi:hypothetical protein